MRLSSSLTPCLPWFRRFDRYFLGLLLIIVAPQFLVGFLSPSTSPLAESSPTILPTASAWEWSDYIVGGNQDENRRNLLSNAEIKELRVRDIKWRLARSHGYGADELARMLDKKDLIAALSTEENKLRTKYRKEGQRLLFWRGVFVAIMCVVAIIAWPLWVQMSEVAAVNWQVYIDRKRHEISQCMEFRSAKGAFGVMLLAILDGLRFWLSATVLLSWVLPSNSAYRRYMFPIPSLPFRPGQFMGDKVANGPLGRYGMNIAPMAITWSMGFARGKIEYWTGKALSVAARQRRKEARSGETEEERKARKAAKKAAKRAAREEQERQQEEAWKKETERRKEMTAKASEQLFGRATSETPKPPEKEDNDETIPNNDFDDAKREFEADMEDHDDMNDLD